MAQSIVGEMPPSHETKSGTVRIADSSNFLVSKTIASTQVVIKPGGLREMHWHPNADEWAYFLKGTGRMTVFNTGPPAMTADFHPGDIGYVKKWLGHYIENTGNTDLVFMEVFRAERFEEVLLADWLAHSPAGMVAETLNLDPLNHRAISKKPARHRAGLIAELRLPPGMSWQRV